MERDLIQLLSGQHGHFQMESGYHSDLWFELNRLLDQRDQLAPFVSELARQIASHRVDVVCGPMVGGAKLAQMIAAEIGATASTSERIETQQVPGLFPIQYRITSSERNSLQGKTVAIVDDAISAGSAIRGTHADLVACGAKPVVVAALFVFGKNAAHFTADHHLALKSIAEVKFNLWKPDECPLCQAGLPFETRSDNV